jgi:hypothetical protein
VLQVVHSMVPVNRVVPQGVGAQTTMSLMPILKRLKKTRNNIAFFKTRSRDAIFCIAGFFLTAQWFLTRYIHLKPA